MDLRVLSPSAEDAIDSIKCISASMRGVSGVVGKSEPLTRSNVLNGGRLNLSCDEACLDNLRLVGEELSTLVSTLEAAIEDHFVGFFTHVKNRHEQELALWVRSSTSMDETGKNVSSSSTGGGRALTVGSNVDASNPFAVANALDQQRAAAMATTTPLPSSTTTTSEKQQSEVLGEGLMPEAIQRDMSFFSLQSWLLVELESLVSTMGVAKGAVYLRGIDNPDFLRLTAVVPRHAPGMPVEVSSASHSVLTTVVASGVGAVITRDPTRGAVPRGEVAFERCMCMPLFAGRATDAASVVGCVIIAEKESGGGDFEKVDELRLWSFCASAAGVFQRYSTEWFVSSLATSRSARDKARPRCNIANLQDKLWVGLDTAASLPPLQRLAGGGRAQILPVAAAAASSTGAASAPARQNKIAFVRSGTMGDAVRAKLRILSSAGSSNFTSHREVTAEDPDEQSHEEVLESVAPYLRNLESLWRRALDENARMKNEVTQWRGQVEVRDARIIELEVALRHLTRQVAAMQSDVAAIKANVPEMTLSLTATGEGIGM